MKYYLLERVSNPKFSGFVLLRESNQLSLLAKLLLVAERSSTKKRLIIVKDVNFEISEVEENESK